MAAWDRSVIARLVAGTLDPETLQQMQRGPKDAERFRLVVELEQERVPWPDRILVPLGEHLYVVDKGAAPPTVKCSCGHEFGDYRRNWKLAALVYERRPDDGLVLAPEHSIDPDWMIFREFYCPSCGTQLEVEAVPPAHPIVFSALPDLQAARALLGGTGA